jgi:putative glutamine amidotransferase
VKIALTRTENPVKHQFYQDWLRTEGDIEIVTLSASQDNLGDFENCSALVLSGGIDIHPKYYRSGNLNYRGAPEKFDEKRDDFEISAFERALEKELPVLGICRGLQLINTACGGTLLQNLEKQEINQVHQGNPDKLHGIRIQPGTLLLGIAGKSDGMVNSAHHQGIDRLGRGLVVNGLSDDGIIEGIEWSEKNGKAFMLGIQWHPERMFKFRLENSELSKKIRGRLLDEAKKRVI